jgi:hypothetical protein
MTTERAVTHRAFAPPPPARRRLSATAQPDSPAPITTTSQYRLSAEAFGEDGF